MLAQPVAAVVTRADAGPPEEDGPRAGRHRAAAGQPHRHARDAQGPGRQAVPADGRDQAVGHALRRGEGTLLPHGRGLRRLPRPHRPLHRGAARLPRVHRPAREHAGDARVRQRRQRRGRPQRVGQREPAVQRHARRPRLGARDARRARRPQDLQPLRERLGDGLQHAVQDVEALRVQRRHGRPVHRLVAGRHEGQGRDPGAVPPRDRPRADGPRLPRRRSPESDQGTRAERLRRREHALQLRRRQGRRRTQDPVLLDARLAGHLARGLEGRDDPSHDRRVEPLQRRHLGALPHRRGPVRAARSGQGEPGQAPGAAEPVVRGGRQERRVPARRPLRRSRSS